MRIAILLRDHCQPKKCNAECRNYCPKVRTGIETVVMGEDDRPIISEELCAGCGICVNKCPFEAIKIIGLPAEIENEIVHQYGKNGFRIYRLPVPRPAWSRAFWVPTVSVRPLPSAYCLAKRYSSATMMILLPGKRCWRGCRFRAWRLYGASLRWQCQGYSQASICR